MDPISLKYYENNEDFQNVYIDEIESDAMETILLNFHKQMTGEEHIEFLRKPPYYSHFDYETIRALLKEQQTTGSRLLEAWRIVLSYGKFRLNKFINSLRIFLSFFKNF